MQRNAETIKRTLSRYRQCNSSANLCVAAPPRQISTLFKQSLSLSRQDGAHVNTIAYGFPRKYVQNWLSLGVDAPWEV
mgnify:CR=1 FL=1